MKIEIRKRKKIQSFSVALPRRTASLQVLANVDVVFVGYGRRDASPQVRCPIHAHPHHSPFTVAVSFFPKKIFLVSLHPGPTIG